MAMGCGRWLAAAGLVLGLALSASAEDKVAVKYQWSVEASYPRLGLEAIDKQNQAWLEKYIAACVGEASELASTDPDYPEGSWSMWTNYQVTRPSDAAVSVVFSSFTYPSGAAHPSGEMRVINYATAAGEVLTLDDLFADPERALALMAEHAPGIISGRMKEERKDDFPDGLAEDEWFKSGFEPDRDNYANLGLEPEGVRVYFQQYQVLPYVFGMPDPLIPLSLLEPAGPNRAVWPKK